jgi:hypothetical protein
MSFWEFINFQKDVVRGKYFLKKPPVRRGVQPGTYLG